MKIVTGGAGFIGSNIVKQLNNRGINDILIVDDLTDGRKCRNLQGLDFMTTWIMKILTTKWQTIPSIVAILMSYSMKELARIR